MRPLLAMLLLGACAPWSSSDTPERSDDDSERVSERSYTLDDPNYRFCHETGPYSADLRKWCAVSDRVSPDRCEGFHALCDADPADDISTPSPGCGSRGGGVQGSVPAQAPQAPTGSDATDWTPPLSCDPPESTVGWVSMVLKSLFALFIALLVVVVIRLVVWAIQRRTDAPRDVPAPVHAPPPILESVALTDEIPDVPSDDLLASAERAVQEGRPGDAVLLSRAAALRHLSDAGAVELKRSRTDREYLRSLSHNTDVSGPLGVVVRAVESLRWGGSSTDTSEARAVISAVRKLLGVALALVLVVLVGAADSDFRFGPDGDAAIAELFDASGYQVSWRLRSLSSLNADTQVLVLDLSGISPTQKDWLALREWVSAGGVLLVAGAAEVGLPELGSSTGADVEYASAHDDVPLPAWPSRLGQGWTGGEATALVEDSSDSVALVSHLKLGAGDVYAIRDAQLLWNAALMVEDNEQLLLGLLRRSHGDALPLQPEQTQLALALIASSGADNPISALNNAQLLPFVLQLLLLMAVAGLWLGWPFAPLRDPASDERRHFVDHVDALGSRYRRLRARSWVVAAYARWALLRYGAAGVMSRAERSGRTRQEAVALVQRTRAVAEGGETADDLNELEELWKMMHRD